MATEQHTPTPWQWHVNHQAVGDLKGCIIRLGDWELALVLSRPVGSQATCEANAEFIVRAVNSYDAMLDALREARKWIGGQPARSTCKYATPNEMVAAIDAALSASEKE